MEEHGTIRRFDKSVPDELKLTLRLAKDNGWWIYQRSTKKWYTPQEFQNEAFRLLVKEPGGHTNGYDFVPMNPWDGLRRRVDYLQKVMTETIEFSRRLEAHYKASGIFK